jgi:hypothetical protein
MFFNTVFDIGSNTNVEAIVRTFGDVAMPALRLAHNARSGHSAYGGVAERVGFSPGKIGISLNLG